MAPTRRIGQGRLRLPESLERGSVSLKRRQALAPKHRMNLFQMLAQGLELLALAGEILSFLARVGAAQAHFLILEIGNALA